MPRSLTSERAALKLAEKQPPSKEKTEQTLVWASQHRHTGALANCSARLEQFGTSELLGPVPFVTRAAMADLQWKNLTSINIKICKLKT
jgi:hypothetical protein